MSKLNLRKLNEPLFCFTSDLDWNPDAAVQATVELFERAKAKLTVFATHKTPVVQESALVQVGVHPNFLPGSTHGGSFAEVMEHVFGLFPQAETYRSHSYFDNQAISEAMSRRGIRYDANLSLYLQERATPLRHCHGTWRFPTFFDDNIHWFHGGAWDFRKYRAQIDSPGLKIFNFHPYPIALNIPSLEYYGTTRKHFKTLTKEDAARHRYAGSGPVDFLGELLEFISSRYPTYTLKELYQAVIIEQEDNAPHADIAGRPAMSGSYEASNTDARKALVLEQYEKMDAANVYATSRDYHLRELEIAAIARYTAGGADTDSILDCGCGNGYTLISLGRQRRFARMLGVDFSENLVSGARGLVERFRPSLKSIPEFRRGDLFEFLRTDDEQFDFIVTERVIVNLPTEELQDQAIRALIGKLKPGGRYLMMEGTQEGFATLNRVRRAAGLGEIPDRYAGNESSRKLPDERVRAVVEATGAADTVAEENFSLYNLVSKTVHPLFVAPEEPRFSGKMNECAAVAQRALDEAGLSLPDVGAGKMWVIRRR